ncbi:multidrug resistance-associated protein 1-like [Haliotis cracherodii]|uniref:multidrug resistance-associated protein 1-like n=1 Tax=Haliotis cracherodii TaxID=6455 RepID=UPI0039E9576D
MASLCNGTPVWDTNLTWYNTWPQFTDCFQSTVLVWVPCGWLWLTSPFYLYYLLNVTPTSLSSYWKYYMKMMVCGLLVLVSALEIIRASSEEHAGNFSANYIAPILKTITFVYVMVLLFLERRKGLTTSGVIFIFCVLLTVAAVVPFYTNIIQEEYDVDMFKFCMFYVYFALVIVELILSCFAESSLQDKRASPEVSASFLSRITFWWANSLILRGYKKVLTENDVDDLHPRDLSANNVPRFLSAWEKEVSRDHISLAHVEHDVAYSKSNGVSVEDCNERTPLISRSTSNKDIKDPPSTDKKLRGKISLMKVLWKALGFEFLQSQIWKLFYDLLYITNPLLLGELINFTEDKASPSWRGYALGVILSCSILIQSLSFQATWHQSYSMSLRFRAIVISAIYRKALTMNIQSRRESTVGEIVNLMSVDTEHIRLMIQWFWGSWSSVLQMVLALYLLFNTLGLAMLAGLGLMVVIMPLNYVNMTFWDKFQSSVMKFKDNRMKIINEVLNGIKILKLYAWEPSFKGKITDVRENELKGLWKISILHAMMMFIFTLAPYLVTLVTFLTYIYTAPGHYLSPKTAFVAVALLNNLRFAMLVLPEIIADFVRANVSIKRIEKYLNSGDLDDNSVQRSNRHGEAVAVTDATFIWNEEMGPTLKDINLKVKTGQLVAVVGQVGAGKSSLISAMFGEMHKSKGQVCLKGKLAYVPQQAWIQNDTLQNNILFGKSMDRERYDEVVECCALTPDLEMLPGGDMTEIGERGINLSGGQKQRVSLARAVYNDADIYLLDDPLSAVDSHVGKHIFDKLICSKGLLAKKTRILVTHGIHWLPEMDSILVMTSGQISEKGTYEELLQHNGPFAQFLQTYLLESRDNNDDDPEEMEMKRMVLQRLVSVTSEEDTEDGVKVARLKSLTESLEKSYEMKKRKKDLKEEVKQESKLVEEEKVEEGKVPWRVYGVYARAVGMGFLIFCSLLYVVYQAASVTSSIWLSQWTDNPDLNNLTFYPANSSQRLEKNNYYLGVYGGLGVMQAVSMLTFTFLWGFRSVHAARVLHHGMLANILQAPMSFFDTTPTGRIANRFSQDIEAIDTLMSHLIEITFNTFLMVLSCVIVIAYSTPIFLAVVVPLFIMYYFILVFYIGTSRQLKRIESKTRSPIYSHFGETLSGASVIRAFQEQSRFIRASEERVDKNQRFNFYSFSAQRWLGFRLELLGNVILLAASMFAVSSRDSLSGGIVGLSVSYALQITSNLNWLVRAVTDLETQVVSVERVKQYSGIESEAGWSIPDQRPDAGWPQQGVVRFLDYSTRYRQGLDLVLKCITCTVNSGEKVGIVGRTGAGKSSLTLSLFRLIEAAGGEINIDGVDVSTLGLHDLRSKLTILPQDPVLFAGSLRSNVDPFNQYSDGDIWRALEHAHLKKFVDTLPEGIEHECSEGGDNMSVGQRQLLCLARALLKKTKILVLDEATAAVDMETDDLIQQTIRSEFKDCTVLTIAHRLNTVMDYDRILVLDNGCVCEFDTPSSLLQQPDSIFYSMAKAAGLTS